MSRNSLPPGMKISFCVGRSAPPDSTSAMRRQPVLLGDLRGAEDLLHRPRVAGAALHRRVVGGDHALDALDHADAGDHAGADREVRAPAGQRRQLEERRALVDEQLDPLAGQQLAAVVVAVDVLLPAARHGLGVLGLEVGELLEHRLAVGLSGHGCLDHGLHPLERGAHAPLVGAAAQLAHHRPVEAQRQHRLEPEVLGHGGPVTVGLEPVAPVVDGHVVGADRELEDLVRHARGDLARATSTSARRRCACTCPSNDAPTSGPVEPRVHLASKVSGENSPIRVTSLTSAHTFSGGASMCSDTSPVSGLNTAWRGFVITSTPSVVRPGR